MNTYDMAVVLGLHFGPHWRLHADLKKRLSAAAELYKAGRVPTILVSGRWTLWFDWLHIQPPITEAQLMQRYLIQHGVRASDILLEQYSKDTVGNLYYLKLFLRRHIELKHIVIICASQQEARIKFLAHKFLGPHYTIDFYAIPAKHYRQSALGKEARLLREEQIFLKDVRPGHDEDLHHQLYSRPYYRRQAQSVAAGLTKVRL